MDGLRAMGGASRGQGAAAPRALALPPQAKCIRKIVPFSFGDFKLTIVNNVIEVINNMISLSGSFVHARWLEI